MHKYGIFIWQILSACRSEQLQILATGNSIDDGQTDIMMKLKPDNHKQIAIIFHETAVKAIGLTNPIGKQ